MTIAEFKSSLENNEPPESMNPLLKALWFDAKGDWTGAHETAQNINTKEGSLIHAYLHRKEGDLSNASYWYSRAGRTMPDISLQKEAEYILNELVNK